MADLIKDAQLVLDDIENLEKLLTRENKVLSGPPTVKLNDITNEKKYVLRKIASYRLTDEIVENLDDETLAVLSRCKKLNEENNLLVNQRLKVVRETNSIFRNHVNNANVPLYDDKGKLVQARSVGKLVEV